jgi:hypothetical protein
MRKVIGLVIGLLALSAAPVNASAPGTFHATVAEEFAFFGCSFDVDPTTIDLCGTAKSHGQGKANTTTLITGFDFGPNGCFLDTHETTFWFKRGDALTVEVNGLLCPTGGQNFNFAGTYDVLGGTGMYAGATGSGLVVGQRQNSPVISGLDGTLVLN